MSEKIENAEVKVEEQPKVKLAEGLFKPFTLGSVLVPGDVGNKMSNVKPNMMDYEKQYQGSTKNQQMSAEDLSKLNQGEVKKGKFQEVSSAIQREKGYSKERADAIAAAAGRKELGQKEMTRRAEEGKKDKAKKSVTEDEILSLVPVDQRDSVLAEMDKRIEKARKSSDEMEAQRVEKAKEKAKKAWLPGAVTEKY